MFALRNKGGPEAVDALSASFAASASALLKHEVAYVLGQMQDAHAVDMLRCEAARALHVCMYVCMCWWCGSGGLGGWVGGAPSRAAARCSCELVPQVGPVFCPCRVMFVVCFCGLLVWGFCPSGLFCGAAS